MSKSSLSRQVRRASLRIAVRNGTDPYKVGYTEGHQAGYAEGLEKGRSQGYKAAFIEAQAKLDKLMAAAQSGEMAKAMGTLPTIDSPRIVQP